MDLSAVFATQFTCFGVAWLALSAFGGVHRTAARLWGLYNLLQAVSGILTGLGGGGGVLHTLGLWVGILGYASASCGIDAFVHGQMRYLRVWGLMVLLFTVGLFVWPVFGSPRLTQLLTLNASAIVITYTAIALFWRPLVAEFGRFGWLFLAPSATFSTFLLLRLVAALWAGAWASGSAPSGPHLGLFVFVLAVATASNVAYLGLMVTRLLQQIRQLAGLDALTGLPNRRATADHLDAEIARTARHPAPLAVAYVDVDHFKAINDTGGHDFGDRVLKQAAQRLRGALRTSDLVGRWGGEEFVVVMPHTTAEAALEAARRMHQALQDAPVLRPDGVSGITVSIGLASMAAGERLSAQTLLVQADRALYRAKTEGRNRTVTARPEPT